MAGAVSRAHAAARAYLARGWSVIAVEPRGKRPLIAWRELQSRLPQAGEVEAWFAERPDANVGVVTGAVSNLVVLDVDARHGGEESLAAARA
ncbi:MAG: bifunctional DNA primase/polymerase [Pseudomonadota bacterium]